ncbi:MAG: 1-acyl-sn-glycerol-3-phosphate acyltransferase [Nitrospirae bacterium]|nr:1-acyl-sn-glycerol-3-phosphate acyltransferase [Nitrospirota bacterium]
MDRLQYINGSYATPKKNISVFSKMMPELCFYQNLYRIVSKCASMAKRGMYDNEAWWRSSLDVMNALENVGVHLEIDGTDNFISLDGPAVFIGNHMSALETFVLPGIISSEKQATFVIKEGLIDYPVFKHLMRATNPIAVSRANAREDLKKVLEEGTERLKSGISVIIFPQTTRIAIFDAKSFNTIGLKLAKRAEVPIIPFALKTDAWGNGKRLKDFGKISPDKTAHIAFGKPLFIKDRGTEEHNLIIDFIAKKLGEWGGEVC